MSQTVAPEDVTSLTVRRRLIPDDEDEAANVPSVKATGPRRIDVESVEILYRNLPASLIANLVVGVLLLFALWHEVQTGFLPIWFAALATVVALRTVSLVAFKHSARPLKRTRPWVWTATLGAFASGGLWGATALIFMHLESAPHQMFTILAVVGLSAGSLPANAVVYSVYGAFVTGVLVPYSVMFLYVGTTIEAAGRVNLGLAGISLAYTAVMLVIGVITHRQLRKNMKLAMERQLLLDNLDKAKRKLEVSNIELRNELQEREKIQKNLKKAKEDAEKANNAKTVFLSTISHEIRTPLNAILGMTEALDDTPLNDEQVNHVKVCRNASGHLLELINNVLDITRIESGGFDLNVRPFLLRDLLEKTTDVARAAASGKGLEVGLNVAENVPEVVVSDPYALRIVLMNLLGNAVKFTEKGQVNLQVESVGASNGKCSLTFAVSDTGVGIAVGKQKEVLSPFKQAEESVTRRFGGSGLGLSICKSLTEMLGGVLLIESEKGKGSTFSVALTIDKGDGRAFELLQQAKITSLVDEASENKRKLDPDAAAVKILIVDDTIDNRLIVRTFLKDACFEFIEAENGKVGVELFQKHEVDLVFMDLHMPVMDGLTALKKIREWEKAHARTAVPIFVLTADIQEKNATEMAKAGCTDYLLKPVSKKQLRQVISRYVEFPAESSKTA